MYDALTYEELRSLSDELKTEALKELKEKYPTNKALGEKLGVSHIVVANMVAKYVEGKHIGRKKAEHKIQSETIDIPEGKTLEMVPAPVKQRRKRRLENKNEEKVVALDSFDKNTGGGQDNITNKHEIVTAKEVETRKASKFTIEINDDLEGEELKCMLQGIIQSMSSSKNYKIELKIQRI